MLCTKYVITLYTMYNLIYCNQLCNAITAHKLLYFTIEAWGRAKAWQRALRTLGDMEQHGLHIHMYIYIYIYI